MKPSKCNETQQQLGSESDFGEGEIEDTQVIKHGNNGFTYFSQGPSGSSSRKETSKVRGKGDSRLSHSVNQSTTQIPTFQSIYDKKMLDTYPSRTRWEIPDSKIVFSSQFCSGNLSRAQRGYQKNTFDLWVAHDAAPHMEGDYYKTWFYFSVTGMPQGELITFTFKNLNNQVSITI